VAVKIGAAAGRPFVPFRVFIQLDGPIYTNGIYPITLDSILTNLAARRHCSGYYDNTDIVDIEIPLKQSGREKKYYHASIMLYSRVSFYKEPIRMKMNAYIDAPKELIYSTDPLFEKYHKKERLDNRSGPYKSRDERLLGIIAPTVNFFGCGDIEWVSEIMQDLTSLGKKAPRNVRKITVEPEEHDYSVFMNDILMRPVPASEVFADNQKNKCFQMLAGYKPPYWLEENRTICHMPDPRLWIERMDWFERS